jgi:hypothetical protein
MTDEAAAAYGRVLHHLDAPAEMFLDPALA